MDHGKKKFPGAREASKKERPLGLVIVLAAAGGVVLGSVATYILTQPPAVPTQTSSPAASGTSPAPAFTMPSQSPPQQPQFTPAPQPPGEVPPGKVWSVEHGHWHDAPAAQITPVPAPPAATQVVPPTSRPIE